jgi:ABC-type Fe3+ transport system permease subunit
MPMPPGSASVVGIPTQRAGSEGLAFQQRQQAEEGLALPPLPAPEGVGFRLPPTAPITWTFMITYLVIMLVVPIVALLVRHGCTSAKSPVRSVVHAQQVNIFMAGNIPSAMARNVAAFMCERACQHAHLHSQTKSAQTPASFFLARAFEPVAMHAYFVSFSCALAAAAINAVLGFLLAWVLVKCALCLGKLRKMLA